MIIAELKDLYIQTLEQVRQSWMRLLAWNGIWVLVSVIGALVSIEWIIRIIFVSNADMALGVFYYFTVLIVSAILWTFGVYSILGVAHETERDPYCSWGLCGIQGILHPLKALGISVGSFILYQIMFFIILLLTIIGVNLGVIGLAIDFIVSFVGVLFFCIFLVMIYFAQMDREDFAPVASIRKVINILTGNVFKTLGYVAPVFLVCMLCFEGAIGLFIQSHEGDVFDLKCALNTKVMIQEEHPDDHKGVISFNYKVPEYEGNVDNYISELAKYGYLYESHLAKIENRPMSEEAVTYIEDHPVNDSVKKLFSIVLGCLGVAGLAFSSVLMLNVYRRREEEYDADFQNKPEKKDDNKIAGSGSVCTTNDGNVAIKSEIPQVANTSEGVSEGISEALSIVNGENAKSEQPVVIEKKKDVIEMDFSLDIAGTEQPSAKLSVRDSGKRKKSDRIALNLDDLPLDKFETKNDVDEKAILGTGEGSLSNTLDSLLGGFSKDEVKK